MTSMSAQAQPSPTPAPAVTVTKEELKKSADRFQAEAEKTKEEINKAKEDTKPVPKATAPAARRARVTVKIRQARLRARKNAAPSKSPKEQRVTTETINPGGEVIIRVTVPPEPVEVNEELGGQSKQEPVQKRKGFWRKLWHYLPLRFFGEH